MLVDTQHSPNYPSRNLAYHLREIRRPLIEVDFKSRAYGPGIWAPNLEERSEGPQWKYIGGCRIMGLLSSAGVLPNCRLWRPAASPISHWSLGKGEPRLPNKDC